MSVMVTQIGARLHYGAAHAFEQYGLLDCLVTDMQSTNSLLELGIKSLRRYRTSLPPHKVYYRNVDGWCYRLLLHMSHPYQTWPHDFAAEALAEQALEVLRKRDPRIVYGFDTAMLPLMHSDTKKHRRTYVLEQCIAPRATQIEAYRALQNEVQDPHLNKLILGAAGQSAIERAEWALADRIVCPSQFVREALIKEGCESSKISVVPYGFSLPKWVDIPKSRELSSMPTALFVGGLSYRKGAKNLLSIAKRLSGRVRVRAIGQVSVPEPLRSELVKYVEVLGSQPFPEVLKHYRSCDFLLLPSYVEGSATVVFEAMSMGMPCIVTHQTGSVIVSGESGFIFEAGAGATDSFVEAINTPLASPKLYSEMSDAALSLSKEYTAEKYATRLVDGLNHIVT